MTSTHTITGDITGNLKTMRLKIIKPVFEKLVICEEDLPDYLVKNKRMSTASDVFQMFKSLVNTPRETFICLHLNNKNVIQCVDVCSVGSLTASIVHPREIFIPALLSGAAALCFIHQHPSGDPEPSREDLDITTRLKQCGELLGIRVLDHIIIGQERYVSLADRGLL
jgi:DNA repair protein RadC